MNRIAFCVMLMAFCTSLVNAQNVGISSTLITPDVSSMLEVRATNKGILIPMVALTGTTDAATITTPATSLMVYNTATSGAGATAVYPGYYYNAGTTAAPNWQRIATNRDAWNTIGNWGTNAATNWLGTNDAADLAIRTNNTERIRVLSTGNVGINTTAPTQQLHVVGSSLVTNNMYVSSANRGVVRYSNLGLYGQTTAWGPNGANNGVWIEGNDVESGGFFANGNTAVIWSPGDADILRIYDEDMLPAGDPRVVIDWGGNMGLDVVVPDDKLDVAGNAQVSGYLRVGNPATPSTVPNNTGTTLWQWNNQNGLYDLLAAGACGTSWSYLISGLSSYYRYDNIGAYSYAPLYTPFIWVPTTSNGVRVELSFNNSLENSYDGVYIEYSTDGVTWTLFNNWSFQGYNDAGVNGSNGTCNGGYNNWGWTNTGDYGPLSNPLAVQGNWVRFRIVGTEDNSNGGGDFRLYGFTVWTQTITPFGGAFAAGNIYAQNNVYAGSNVLLGDVAEYFPVDGISKPGYIIALNPDKKDAYTISRKPYDANAIGIHSTNPTVTINDPNSGVPVALTGRVPVMVTNENGLVQPGDYLTSSSRPGYAMKADKAGYVIGQALDYLKEGEGLVLCLLKPGWYSPEGNSAIASGEFFVPSGQQEITVIDQAIGTKSKIFLTMLGDPGARYWISKKGDGQFTITLSEPSSANVPFDYLVENANEKQAINQCDVYNTILKPIDFETGGWQYDPIKNTYWREEAMPADVVIVPVPETRIFNAPPVPENPENGYVWDESKGLIEVFSASEIVPVEPTLSPMDHLNLRLRKGEISPEEFETQKRLLGF